MPLDLRALSETEIAQMEYKPHELWFVKFQDEIFGPFEEQSLKHYALENEPIFELSQAARSDLMEWTMFFHYECFSPVKALAQEQNKLDKYWLLDKGQKIGPFLKEDILKKIEIGSIHSSFYVSKNESDEWFKLYQLEEFEIEHAKISDVVAPLFEEDDPDAEYEFESTIADELVEMLCAQPTQAVKLNVSELHLKRHAEPTVNPRVKWIIPGVVSALVVVAVMINFSGSEPEVVEFEEAPVKKTRVSKAQVPNPSAQGIVREPANYQPTPASAQRSALTHFNQRHETIEEYPAHTQIHENEQDHYDHLDYYADKELDEYNRENGTPIPSLVNKRVPAQTHEESLDQMMNEMPEQPVVDEAGDF